MRATSLEDGDGGRWIPSTQPGSYDLDTGDPLLTGWARKDIEALCPPVREVEEP